MHRLLWPGFSGLRTWMIASWISWHWFKHRLFSLQHKQSRSPVFICKLLDTMNTNCWATFSSFFLFFLFFLNSRSSYDGLSTHMVCLHLQTFGYEELVICLLFFSPHMNWKYSLLFKAPCDFSFETILIFQTSTRVKSFVRIQAFFTQVNWPIFTSWSSEHNYYLVENVRKESMFYNGDRGSDCRKRVFFFFLSY